VIHRARTRPPKVPVSARAEVKAAYWQIFDDILAPPGEQAVACLTSTLGELTAHLRFPHEHWQRIRYTNLLKQTFGETRRRTKIIGRLPGESSCLRLVWAVLDRASRG
jgi:transposase-like protein